MSKKPSRKTTSKKSTESEPAKDDLSDIPAQQSDTAAIDDAEIISEEPASEAAPDTIAADSASDDAVSSGDDTVETSATEDVATSEASDTLSGSGADDALTTSPEADDVLTTEGAEDSLGASQAEAQPESSGSSVGVPVAPEVIKETVIERRAGFVPTLLGGILAAGAGFGLSQYLGGTTLFGDSGPSEFEISTQASLDDLSTRLDEVGSQTAAIDLAPLQSGLDAQTSAQASLGETVEGLSGSIAGLQATLDENSAQLDSFAERIATLEKRPTNEGLTPEGLAAYEADMQALRDEITAQRDEVIRQREEISTMAQEAVAAEEAAAAAERVAERQADLAAARAALSEVIAALDAGTPYEEPLADVRTLSGMDVPEVLEAAAASGVTTQSQLIADFPDQARAALRASRSESDGAEAGVGGFLRAQLGARSLEARDGDDPDAVLSRAEAELRDGNIDAALTELEALPEGGRAALSEWIAQANTRRTVTDAAAELRQSLTSQ